MNRYRLSPMQHGMLYHHLAEPQSDVEIVQVVCTFREPLNELAFVDAWRDLIARHPVLRTVFHWQGLDEPLQEIVSEFEPPFEELRDWRTLDDRERERRFEAAIRKERARGFDLSRAPLFRLSLFRFHAEEYRLIWSFHHIVMDGRSIVLCLQDLFAMYDARREGLEIDLAPPPDYQDHVCWLEGRDTPN